MVEDKINKGIRFKIYKIMDVEQEHPDAAAIIFEIFITSLIILSVVSIVLESFIDNQLNGILTENDLRVDQIYIHFLNFFETFTLVIFTVEYFLRVLTADFIYPNEKNYLQSVRRFVCSWGGIIDFIAIAPFIFHIVFLDFRFLRALKFTRLLRVFKLSAMTNSVKIVGDVFVEKRNELGVTLFVTFILLLVSSTLMWYVEGSVQPKAFPNIVASFWWAIATLTTVGYGDVYPITGYGKLLSGIIAVLGIGIVALPAGILSSAFIEKLEKEKELKKALKKEIADTEDSMNCHNQFGEKFLFCPYCGNKLDENGKHTEKKETN